MSWSNARLPTFVEVEIEVVVEVEPLSERLSEAVCKENCRAGGNILLQNRQVNL